MTKNIIGLNTEMAIQRAANALADKAAFDAYAELLKLGIISQETFISCAKEYVNFEPDEQMHKVLD